MALPIGHRNGVPIRRKGGLSRIKSRHGIPFYNPAETYYPHDYLPKGSADIRFMARGKLTEQGGQYENAALKASALLRLLVSGTLTGTTSKVIPKESEQMHGETNIHFFTSAKLKGRQKMVGVSWIVFYSKLCMRRMFGHSDITFTTSGMLRGYKLRGLAIIQFSASLAYTPFTPIKYGLDYNWFAATDARNICSVGCHVPT